jgi:hypothetical protein
MECLEERRLLSAQLVSDVTVSPAAGIVAAAGAAGPAGGYTPAQIRAAYGADPASLLGGAITGDGSRQTIAIVDAYNDPNIASDLHAFDVAFGLNDPPTFTKVDQSGGTNYPKTDGGWSTEIALDVEWAHAVAPGASILLVEAKSAGITDLLSAVDYARKAAGVSVVSMSWGGSEFFGQTAYDSHFTTPAGHAGVTFVSASGDDGLAAGASWPASSPNVLSVGGTTLSLQDSSGTYGGETAWSLSGGGLSRFEAEPGYQANVQSTFRRTTPDVAYDANTNTGFAVYSSVPDGGTTGWSVVGGTSAGTSQWAALVAIADQGRVASGGAALDGAIGTLPLLYQAAGTSGGYAASFHDVVGGGASSGYDVVTGLGTPKAAQLVQALQGTPATTAAPVARVPTPPRLIRRIGPRRGRFVGSDGVEGAPVVAAATREVSGEDSAGPQVSLPSHVRPVGLVGQNIAAPARVSSISSPAVDAVALAAGTGAGGSVAGVFGVFSATPVVCEEQLEILAGALGPEIAAPQVEWIAAGVIAGPTWLADGGPAGGVLGALARLADSVSSAETLQWLGETREGSSFAASVAAVLGGACAAAAYARSKAGKDVRSKPRAAGLEFDCWNAVDIR